MQNRLNDVLYDTAEGIFENLAFVLTMPERDEFGNSDLGFEDFDVNDLGTDLDTDLDANLNAESSATEDDLDVEVSGDTEESESDSFVGFNVDLGFDTGVVSDETIVASIHFSGHFDGDIFLETSCDLLPVIGMNMLGLNDENALTPEEQKDAFKELLNVICGNLMPAVAGDKAVFNIDSAEIYSDTSIPETFEGKNPLANAHFGLEIGQAKLALFVDEKIWEEKNTTAPSCV